MQHSFNSQSEKDIRLEEKKTPSKSRLDALLAALVERFSDPVTLFFTAAAVTFGLWLLLNELIAEHAEELSVLLAKL